MRRLTHHAVGVADLDQRSMAHHRDAVAHMLDDAEVMGDEKRRNTEVLLKIHEQVQDLRLHAHVEGADGLVRDDEFGLGCERRCDTDPLTLTAGQASGKPIDELAIEPDAREKIEHSPIAIRRRSNAKAVERFANAPADRPAGIEAAIWVLKHRLDAPAEIYERTSLETKRVSAIEENRAIIRSDQPEDAASKRAFTTPRLAHEPKRTAAIDADRHIVKRDHVVPAPGQRAG
jgi:hypothetical protein